MTRPLYVWRMNVTIPPELHWPHEPPNWEEVFQRFGWDSGGHGTHPDDHGFYWPYMNRKHWFTREACERRAEVLRALGATVEIVRSEPVEWPA